MNTSKAATDKLFLWVGAILAAVLFVAATFFSSAAYAAVKVGEKAPDFKLVDSDGVEHSLSDFAGRKVILEWSNPNCPYVKKHYQRTTNMQDLQREMTSKDIVWLTILSTAPSHKDYVNGEEAKKIWTAWGAAPSYILMDPSGEVGHLYNAQTTPHMFLLNEDQNILYMGAIDDHRSYFGTKEGVAEATNYVRQALTEYEADEEISKPVTAPYGCSVHY